MVDSTKGTILKGYLRIYDKGRPSATPPIPQSLKHYSLQQIWSLNSDVLGRVNPETSIPEFNQFIGEHIIRYVFPRDVDRERLKKIMTFSKGAKNGIIYIEILPLNECQKYFPDVGKSLSPVCSIIKDLIDRGIYVRILNEGNPIRRDTYEPKFYETLSTYAYLRKLLTTEETPMGYYPGYRTADILFATPSQIKVIGVGDDVPIPGRYTRPAAPPPPRAGPPPPPRAAPPPPPVPDTSTVGCEALLRAHNITYRTDFRKWSVTNHPDKGGDPELFKKVSNCADNLPNRPPAGGKTRRRSKRYRKTRKYHK